METCNSDACRPDITGRPGAPGILRLGCFRSLQKWPLVHSLQECALRSAKDEIARSMASRRTVPVERLAQIRARTGRKAGFLGACFVVAGDHHNRHACTDRGQVLLNLQAAHFRHLHVEHQAIRRMLIKILEEFASGAIGFRLMTRAAQEAPQSGSDSFVVIDDGNVVSRAHAPPALCMFMGHCSAAGSVSIRSLREDQHPSARNDFIR